jgi:hypothetical protein
LDVAKFEILNIAFDKKYCILRFNIAAKSETHRFNLPIGLLLFETSMFTLTTAAGIVAA